MQFSFARDSGERNPAHVSNVVTDGARDEIEVDGPCAVSLKRTARIAANRYDSTRCEKFNLFTRMVIPTERI